MSAISAVTEEGQWTMRLTTFTSQPRWSASRFRVMCRGPRNSWWRISPGVVGRRCRGIMVMGFSMVVADVHLGRTRRRPAEDDPPRVADTDAAPAPEGTAERLDPVSRPGVQVRQPFGEVEHVRSMSV